MGKAIAIIIGVILAGGVLGFLVVQTMRASSQGVTDVVPIRTDILSSDVAEKIKLREINGQIPVVVSPEQYGRDDPFADF